MEPISRSAYAFCQGECAAVITSLMPIAVAVVAHAANAVSPVTVRHVSSANADGTG